MFRFFHRLRESVQPHLNRAPLWFARRKKPAVTQMFSHRAATLSPEKQQALRALCEQLFQKREILISGKLQLIGLAKIKKRMGKRWDGLCAVVYDTVEEVIIQHIGENDLFVRYTDDSYVIIFAHADLELGTAKAALIAEEVRRRLFLLDEEALREIEVRNAVRQVSTKSLSGLDLSDFLGDFLNEPSEPIVNIASEEEKNNIPADVRAVEIDAHDYKPTSRSGTLLSNPPDLKFSYMPLWDVKRGALTTYVCLAEAASGSGLSLFDAHKAAYSNLNGEGRAAADRQVLQSVMKELAMMEKEERKLLIVCPVCYETLFNFESYEIYKEHLQRIPDQQKQFLVLLILKPEKQLNSKNAYWFLPAIKKQSRLFFAEVPLKQGVHFQSLKAMGIDGVGVILGKGIAEQQALSVLGNFSSAAKSHKISLTFVLGVSSLSLITSSVCAGFDYIGGSAVHEAVPKPDMIHKFKYEDIVTALIGT